MIIHIKIPQVKLLLVISSIFYLCSYLGYCQEKNNYQIVVQNSCSAIKNQGNSGTCWSFASISFIESEIKRTRNLDVDLSEWYIVRNIYPEKIRNYIRTQGNTFISPGGQTQDVLWVIRHKGIVPEKVFSGPQEDGVFNSSVIDTSITDFYKVLKWDDNGLISTNWETKLDSILNADLGKKPFDFKYDQQLYNPISFRDFLEINVDDYIQITSFNHHDYYKPFSLETRFNWSYSNYMNLPIKEYIDALDAALLNGYTVALNIDVSENSFKRAVLGTGVVESNHQFVDQNIRQNLFENGKTRVDHIMHIVGIVEKDKRRYYLTKNSWGEIGPLDGFLLISQDYVKSKAMSLTMHIEALPIGIRNKI
ncbi:C1 family peptidase [Aquimarina sediminis]|uniref:C1 family peptidase n=1 Tax=Aquimarina sediminis TaxID=2070536 RepID=UPI0013E8CB85|nr:C1 family peptidase [Aquimarina sediminis]